MEIFCKAHFLHYVCRCRWLWACVGVDALREKWVYCICIWVHKSTGCLTIYSKLFNFTFLLYTFSVIRIYVRWAMFSSPYLYACASVWMRRAILISNWQNAIRQPSGPGCCPFLPLPPLPAGPKYETNPRLRTPGLNVFYWRCEVIALGIN